MAEAKFPDIRIKFLLSQLLSDLCRTDIAGIFNDMFKAEPPEFFHIANPLSRNGIVTIFAEEDIVPFGHLLLEGG